jgi:hypothetical protein
VVHVPGPSGLRCWVDPLEQLQTSWDEKYPGNLLISRSQIARRLALRDLSRYRARSGEALAAVSLAVGTAATIVISGAASRAAAAAAPTGGNLPTNQLIVLHSSNGAFGRPRWRATSRTCRSSPDHLDRDPKPPTSGGRGLEFKGYGVRSNLNARR